MKAVTALKTISTDGRIIILDEPLATEACEELQQLETTDGQELVFLKDRELAIGLEEILQGVINQPDTLLVFPGNGSRYPRGLSQLCRDFPETAEVHAQRFWIPGSDPIVTAGSILPHNIVLNLKFKHIVVVDDVVSSGFTMRKIHENNAWRFPTAKWVGVAWLSQLPLGKFVGGYREVFACTLIRRNKGIQRVPINSVSTLRKDSEIAESYASRHFKEPRRFLHLIKKE